MRRVRLKTAPRKFNFRPQFKGSIEGFLVNQITKQHWRVAKVMSKEDLYQDGVLYFIMLRARYTGIVDNPAWFMSLYSRAFRNHIHDIARVQEKLNLSEPLPEDLSSFHFTSDVDGTEEDTAHSFDNAPQEVLEVVALFLNAPSELWLVLSKAWNARGNRKKKSQTLIAQALGKGEDFDARQLVHDFLDGIEGEEGPVRPPQVKRRLTKPKVSK